VAPMERRAGLMSASVMVFPFSRFYHERYLNGTFRFYINETFRSIRFLP
jgi:hypothetical protein